MTRRNIVCVAIILFAPVLCWASTATGAPCRSGPVRAPVISAVDVDAVQRAVVVLPAAGTRSFSMGIGALVPHDVAVKPIPAVVVKLLPQYAGYQSFRSGFVLMIVSPRSRRISYRFPLRKGFSDAC